MWIVVLWVDISASKIVFNARADGELATCSVHTAPTLRLVDDIVFSSANLAFIGRFLVKLWLQLYIGTQETFLFEPLLTVEYVLCTSLSERCSTFVMSYRQWKSIRALFVYLFIGWMNRFQKHSIVVFYFSLLHFSIQPLFTKDLRITSWLKNMYSVLRRT